tara:strand:- start:626 stop:790 length:165 start_codon:yes stop_codon:yes gene_type:complete
MKKNLVSKKKKPLIKGSYFKIPQELKDDAKVFAIKNNKTLTDLVLDGLKAQIYG